LTKDVENLASEGGKKNNHQPPNLVFPSLEKRRGKQSLNRENIWKREREYFFCLLGARRNGLKLPKLPEVFD